MGKNYLRMFVYTMIIATIAMATNGFAIMFSSYAVSTGAGIILLALFFIEYCNDTCQNKFGSDILWLNVVLVAWNVLNFLLFEIFMVSNAKFIFVWLAIYSSLALLALVWVAFRMWYQALNKNYGWVEVIKGNLKHDKKEKKVKVAKQSKAEKEVKKGTLEPKPTHRDTVAEPTTTEDKQE